MDRRNFFKLAAGGAAGLLVPEWLLDPPKGRSMVQVVSPGLEIGDLVGTNPFGNIVRLEPQMFALGYLVGKEMIADSSKFNHLRTLTTLKSRER